MDKVAAPEKVAPAPQRVARPTSAVQRPRARPPTRSRPGNQTLQRALGDGWMLGRQNDPAERQAEQVAAHFVHGQGPLPAITPLNARQIQRQRCACGGETGPDGMCAACRRRHIQRQSTDPGAGTQDTGLVSDVLRRPGRPLDGNTRRLMESRFGRDFGHVRVHNDGPAARSATALQAHAYTAGSDIVFGPGQYAPENGDGRRLIAHELTHVVQQETGASEEQQSVVRRNAFTDALSAGATAVANVGRSGVEAVGEGLGAAYEYGSEVAGDVVEAAGEGLVAIVESIAPGAIDFFRNLPTMLQETVEGGFDALFGGLGGRIAEEGLAGAFVSLMGDLLGGVAEGIGALVTFSCAAWGRAAMLLQDIALKLGAGALEAIGRGASAVADFLGELWANYGAPAAEAIKTVAGEAWDAIKETVGEWWDKLAPLREAAGRAWEWLKGAFLEAKSTIGSFMTALFEKAVEKWEELKGKIKPFMGYVKVAIGIFLLLSPLGPFIVAGAAAYGLYHLVVAAWNAIGKPMVASVRRWLAEDVLPAIMSGINKLREGIANAQEWISGLLTRLSGLAVSFLEAIGALPFLAMAQQLVADISAKLQAFSEEVQAQIAEVSAQVSSFLSAAWDFVQPILEFMRQSLLIALIGPWAILDDGVWSSVKAIAAFAQATPCLREMAGLARIPWLLEQGDKFREMMKAAWELISNPEPFIQALHDALEPMVASVPGVAATVLAGLIYPDEEQHRLGVQRHLEPAILHLQDNWWNEIKHMAWSMIWPWDEVGKKLPTMIENGSAAIDAVFNLEISEAIDRFLAMMTDVNTILGAIWGWFAIAAVLIGGVLGALGVEFSGGATIGAGMAAGWALAETVGLGLLGLMAGTETAKIGKSMFDIRFNNPMLPENERAQANDSDYSAIANSAFSLAVVTALVILGAAAGKVASSIWSKVQGRVPRIQALDDFLNRPRGSRPTEGVPGERPSPRTTSDPIPDGDTTARPGEFTPEQIQNSRQRASETARNPDNVRQVRDPELRQKYDAEIDLGDGQTYRRNRETGRWCLFRNPRQCGVELGDDVNRAADAARPAEAPGRHQVNTLEDINALRRNQPERPAGLDDAGNALFDEYTAYYNNRLNAMEAQLRAGNAIDNPPRTWESYRDFRRGPFERGRQHQQRVTESMQDPDVTSEFLTADEVGVSRVEKPAPGEVVRPDQLIVDRATNSLTAVSNKSRNFRSRVNDYTTAELRTVRQQVRADVAELFNKYSGDLYVRRPNHPTLRQGQQVHVSEVILVYEGGAMVTSELAQIIMSEARSAATRLNPNIDFHVTFQ